jgi:membrane protease subunit (stomatin/prohibitin family)
MNGQLLDLFGPGRYTLKTANIPILQKIKNITTGGVSPLHCEVYFVHKVERIAIRWGIDREIQYVKPATAFCCRLERTVKYLREYRILEGC